MAFWLAFSFGLLLEIGHDPAANCFYALIVCEIIFDNVVLARILLSVRCLFV